MPPGGGGAGHWGQFGAARGPAEPWDPLAALVFLVLLKDLSSAFPPKKPRCFLHLHGTPQHAGERHGRVPREVLAPQSPVLVSRCLPLLHEGCSGCPNLCRPLLSAWQESRWGLTAHICSLHLPRGPALLNPLSQSLAASPERGTRGCGGWVGVQAVPLDGGSWRGAGG